MTPRQIATAIAAGRMALGTGLAVAPASFGKTWIGVAAQSPGGATAVRAVGVRDAALGLGLLMALRRGRPTRGWVEAGMLADLGDAAATIAAFNHLPPLGRIVTLVMAIGSAATSGAIAGRVDTEEPSPDA